MTLKPKQVSVRSFPTSLSGLEGHGVSRLPLSTDALALQEGSGACAQAHPRGFPMLGVGTEAPGGGEVIPQAQLSENPCLRDWVPSGTQGWAGLTPGLVLAWLHVCS